MQEYLCVDSSPEAVLVAGWSDPGFMGQLLWELDQGQSALPPGKEGGGARGEGGAAIGLSICGRRAYMVCTGPWSLYHVSLPHKQCLYSLKQPS
jgi:hypothetical protein